MDIEEIEYRVNQIRLSDQEEDDEKAHAQEDELYLDFLQYIAKAPNDNQLHIKAKILLQTQELRFSRWCS